MPGHAVVALEIEAVPAAEVARELGGADDRHPQRLDHPRVLARLGRERQQGLGHRLLALRVEVLPAGEAVAPKHPGLGAVGDRAEVVGRLPACFGALDLAGGRKREFPALGSGPLDQRHFPTPARSAGAIRQSLLRQTARTGHETTRRVECGGVDLQVALRARHRPVGAALEDVAGGAGEERLVTFALFAVRQGDQAVGELAVLVPASAAATDRHPVGVGHRRRLPVRRLGRIGGAQRSLGQLPQQAICLGERLGRWQREHRLHPCRGPRVEILGVDPMPPAQRDQRDRPAAAERIEHVQPVLVEDRARCVEDRLVDGAGAPCPPAEHAQRRKVNLPVATLATSPLGDPDRVELGEDASSLRVRGRTRGQYQRLRVHRISSSIESTRLSTDCSVNSRPPKCFARPSVSGRFDQP